MMFVTSTHVLEIKKCRNVLKDNYLLSAVLTFSLIFEFQKIVKGIVKYYVYLHSYTTNTRTNKSSSLVHYSWLQKNKMATASRLLLNNFILRKISKVENSFIEGKAYN